MAYQLPAQPPVITYVAQIPLLVQSDIYMDTLENHRTMHVVSGKLRVALAPRGIETVSDVYLWANKPVDRKIVSQLVYRSYMNRPSNDQWKELPARKKDESVSPFIYLLADTVLQPGDKLFVEFRLRNATAIFQSAVFIRDSKRPEIEQYREKSSHDSIDIATRSKALKSTGKILEGFSKPAGNNFVISAGHHLELLLVNHAFNKDSTVQYRLVNLADHRDSGWKTSGRFLTLPDLAAGQSFSLEMRYEGMGLIKTYHIKVLPFWFQQTWAVVLFSVMGILIVTGVPYLLRRNRIRKEERQRQRAEEQLKNNQGQLNPHFVFNAFSTIEALFNSGEPEKANDYLQQFSDIMRDTFLNRNIVFTSLGKDLAMLERYLNIEQFRFDFKYRINIDPQLDIDAIEFPPMLLQPSVENAVRHGVSGMGSDGLITITIAGEESDLIISIKDNGTILPPEKTKGTGQGILFTKQRIGYLDELHQTDDIHYEIQPSPPGTLVTFHFKNWL
jgi:hypothetical protein